MRDYKRAVVPTATHPSSETTKERIRGDVQVATSQSRTPSLVLRLQREHGNRYVQSLLDRGRRTEPKVTRGIAPTVQRYAVPPDLACGEIVRWLGANSPYAPEWAENRVNYSFSPINFVNVRFNERGVGQVEGTARGMTNTIVLMSAPTDLPVWNPDARPNRAAELQAWQSMLAALRAHENEHIRIGTTWRERLQTRARAVRLTATGSRAEVQAQLTEQLQAQAESWVREAQAEQDQFDTDSDHGARTYRGLPVVTLTCPGALSL